MLLSDFCSTLFHVGILSPRIKRHNALYHIADKNLYKFFQKSGFHPAKFIFCNQNTKKDQILFIKI